MNAYLHLRKIMKHRKYVRQHCFHLGLYWRGLTHDLSKYSLIEFLESVKYYVGSSSPIDKCKSVNGYSLGWLHHKGRNPHHWEYWMDNFQKGGEPILMPYKFAAEMLCDFMAAGKAYNTGTEFSYEREYNWWVKKKEVVKMHPIIIRFIDLSMECFLAHGEKAWKICNFKEIYNKCLEGK